MRDAFSGTEPGHGLYCRDAIELLSNKWRPIVLCALEAGPLRTNHLQRCLHVISAKVLTETLRGMERDGLIERRVRAQVPAHVEYELTPMGADAVQHVLTLCEWVEAHTTKRDEARARYDRRLRRS